MKLLERLKAKNKENKNLKKKIFITILMIIPFISMMLVISFRHVAIPTNEEILEDVKNMKNYESIVEYKIMNDRGSYTDKTKVIFSEKYGTRIDFGEEITKIYKDDYIKMIYNKKKEKYEVKRELDKFYTLATMREIFNNPIISVEEGKDEWGDLEYLKVNFELIFNNNHLDKATLYINKSKKEPMLIKIYDNEGKERVKIEYREFLKTNKDLEEYFKID
ncbi:hypothetical protein J2Z53_002020 [Clostridium moniliforme]|uniref:Membrane associated protein n=1 Tax=Clostridium moniliforme TaxID=39489 RepID=A0ABS4F2E7_9CLOT|nr:germination lipoprotein GerS-related protein [Clostridium moniliforme]MBP1890425.1 hypothetical protein [Clostridium moniliforme]